MTQWTDFVKEYAGKNNISYGCALSDKKVSEAYREKYPKKETKKQKLLTTKLVMSEVLKQLPKKEETVVKYTPPKITDKNRKQLAQKQFDEWEGGVLEDPDETMRYGGKIVSIRHEERDPEWMAEYPFGKADYAVRLNDQFMHHFISRNAERQYNTEREKVLKKINEKYRIKDLHINLESLMLILKIPSYGKPE